MCLSRRGAACFHAAPRFLGNKTISATKGLILKGAARVGLRFRENRKREVAAPAWLPGAAQSQKHITQVEIVQRVLFVDGFAENPGIEMAGIASLIGGNLFNDLV